MGSLGLNTSILILHVSLAMDKKKSLLYTLKNLPSLYYLPFLPIVISGQIQMGRIHILPMKMSSIIYKKKHSKFSLCFVKS